MAVDNFSIVLAIVLTVLASGSILIILQRQGKKCTGCGRRLPRGALHCPHCGRSVSSREEEGKDSPRPISSPVELVALKGPLAPQRFPISDQGLTIGRHPDNDIRLLDDVMVSRHHAVIAMEQGQYVLYDRDSANGTWVNDQRIFRHVLAPGDRIQIWQSQFLFSAPHLSPRSPPSTPAPLPTVHVTGENFCGYSLESLLGRGGMSEVFKARDANGRVVAIKILKETDPYLVTKFVQEGNKIGPLLRGHPNIVYVYEFGQGPDNRLYIVMEFVDAPSLRKVIRKEWTEAEIVSVIGQVCSGLAFAHENQIVHRDIKPENILLSADGVAKIVDFGIAKLTSASTVTRDKIVGTPEYISPEQARGEPVLPASDVYSLGIVLYEMQTGSVPFRRPSTDDSYMAAVEVIRQHLKENPEPLHKRNPARPVSRRLEKVTMRALSKDLKSRYPTAREMGLALGYSDSSGFHFSTALSPKADLLVVRGPRKGQRIPLERDGLTLGRFELGSSDITVSRRHATIFYRGGGYWLQDTSKNGTWVDNQRVCGEVPLKTGSMIVIGDSVLRLDKALDGH